MNIFENYLKAVSFKFKCKETSEMGYGADFEVLITEIVKQIYLKKKLVKPHQETY